MSVIYKSGGRKPLVVGSVTIGYGNYAVPGLLENKHVKFTVQPPLQSDVKPHNVSMTFAEAEAAAIAMLRTIMEHGDCSLDKMIEKLSARATGMIGWDPIVPPPSAKYLVKNLKRSQPELRKFPDWMIDFAHREWSTSEDHPDESKIIDWIGGDNPTRRQEYRCLTEHERV